MRCVPVGRRGHSSCSHALFASTQLMDCHFPAALLCVSQTQLFSCDLINHLHPLGAGDKQQAFVGSKQWIGAIELGFVLDTLLGVPCKVITVPSGADMPTKAREIAHHFDTQGETEGQGLDWGEGSRGRLGAGALAAFEIASAREGRAAAAGRLGLQSAVHWSRCLARIRSASVAAVLAIAGRAIFVWKESVRLRCRPLLICPATQPLSSPVGSRATRKD